MEKRHLKKELDFEGKTTLDIIILNDLNYGQNIERLEQIKQEIGGGYCFRPIPIPESNLEKRRKSPEEYFYKISFISTYDKSKILALLKEAGLKPLT
ncbi:MAG: hypothetical protein IB618_00770 [Candidatus Pacearchaeota archaeon]|nr:MAG: hypothetical protein IB618_00770 [Candidatus Pacearchaeota archaeon]